MLFYAQPADGYQLIIMWLYLHTRESGSWVHQIRAQEQRTTPPPARALENSSYSPSSLDTPPTPPPTPSGSVECTGSRHALPVCHSSQSAPGSFYLLRCNNTRPDARRHGVPTHSLSNSCHRDEPLHCPYCPLLCPYPYMYYCHSHRPPPRRRRRGSGSK